MSLLGLLRYAPWVIAGLAVTAALWYRGEYKDCQASIATDAAKAQERARVLREADEAFTNRLEDAARGIKDAIRDESTNTQVALAKVRSDPNCRQTPAAAAFDATVVPKPRIETPVRK